MIRFCFVIIVCLICVPIASADDFASLIEEGNAAYERQEYNTALDLYRQAESERPESPEIYYNLGNALQQTGKFESSVEKYESALNSDDIPLLAQTYYNGSANKWNGKSRTNSNKINNSSRIRKSKKSNSKRSSSRINRSNNRKNQKKRKKNNRRIRRTNKAVPMKIRRKRKNNRLSRSRNHKKMKCPKRMPCVF